MRSTPSIADSSSTARSHVFIRCPVSRAKPQLPNSNFPSSSLHSEGSLSFRPSHQRFSNAILNGGSPPSSDATRFIISAKYPSTLASLPSCTRSITRRISALPAWSTP